jgi:protein-S-isoprenylcysteine O-methyltransferase Ste14
MLPLVLTNHTAALILLEGYFVWLLPEIIHTFSHRIEAGSRADDRYSNVVVQFCLGVSILLANWLMRVQTWGTIYWHPILIFGIGIAFVLGGVAFRWYAIYVLGKYFSVRLGIQPGQTVMKDGPYRWIRHPSYTGSLITMLGFGLAFTNWLCLVSVPLIVLIGYSYRANVEERMLVTALGDPYREYMKNTKRFIPFVY